MDYIFPAGIYEFSEITSFFRIILGTKFVFLIVFFGNHLTCFVASAKESPKGAPLNPAGAVGSGTSVPITPARQKACLLQPKRLYSIYTIDL